MFEILKEFLKYVGEGNEEKYIVYGVFGYFFFSCKIWSNVEKVER